MTDKQYKKMKWAFTLLCFLMLSVIVSLLLLLSKPQRASQINNFIGQRGESGQSIVGPQGPIGAQGLAGIGLQGSTGDNGSTTIINNTTNTPVPGPQGEKGDPGVAGADGRQLLLKVDPTTCQLESKYDGDDFWQIIAQLPTPCEAPND